MAIKRKYQKNLVLGDEFLKDTGNIFRVVTQRAYVDKRGRLDDGILFTLQITQDNGKYEVGEDNMIMETFDVYVLCGSHDVGLKKGDYCSLHDFMPDVSYYIDFNYILRFRNIEKIEKKQ